MHKKLESELVSLAHSILQLKNKEDVLVLKKKSGELYEKLSVLAFVNRFVEAEPTASKSMILEKVEAAEQLGESLKTPLGVSVETPLETKVVLEKGVEEVTLKQEISTEEKKTVVLSEKMTLEKELEGTISLDVTTDLFENAIRIETPRKSLNDVLTGKNLQIDLNDRIAFVKHLFDGSQGDFNRVVSQLNSFKSEKEAITFVSKVVKLDYDWNGKEAYEERFITLISRKFA